jgi:uncharacterized membrane protein
MRNLLTAAFASIVALVPVACNNPQGGSSGTKDSFTLDLTTSQTVLGTALKKGETKEIELTLKANKEFKGKVELKADHPDKFKTELKPSSVDVTPGQDTKVHLMVTNDGAPAGDATIRVTATPDHGTAISREVKVKAE